AGFPGAKIPAKSVSDPGRFWWESCRPLAESGAGSGGSRLNAETGSSDLGRPAYLSVELNAHKLLYLILLVQQKQLPPQSLYIHTFRSQACESIFRNMRALRGVYSTIVNFTVHDFLRRAQRLSLLNDIK
ncbi:unnamed protein product, partial [Rotaria magnacalcarata]